MMIDNCVSSGCARIALAAASIALKSPRTCKSRRRTSSGTRSGSPKLASPLKSPRWIFSQPGSVTCNSLTAWLCREASSRTRIIAFLAMRSLSPRCWLARRTTLSALFGMSGSESDTMLSKRRTMPHTVITRISADRSLCDILPSRMRDEVDGNRSNDTNDRGYNAPQHLDDQFVLAFLLLCELLCEPRIESSHLLLRVLQVPLNPFHC